MAYNGRYSIAIRILLLKKYFEANAGRNRYVKPQEIHDFLKEYELDVEKKALYADFAVLGDIFGLQLEYDPNKKGYRLLNPPFFAWIATFGRRVKILSPEPVVEKMRDFLQRSMDMYKDEG